MKLLDEKLVNGYPGTFPSPPNFKDHLSRLSSSFDQIRQTTARKLTGESKISIKGSESACQMLNDDLHQFRKKVETFESESLQFERDIQRNKDSARRDYEYDVKIIDNRYTTLVADLENELTTVMSDEDTLTHLKLRSREGFDRWFSAQTTTREVLDKYIVKLRASGHSSEDSRLVYLPMYLVDYSTTKKVRFSLVAPHIIEVGRKTKIKTSIPSSIDDFSVSATKYLERKFKSWQKAEILKENNQLRSADIQEAFERGIRAAEHRNIFSSKEATILSEKYYRNFVTT